MFSTTALAWAIAISAVMFVASLVALPLLVVNIPTDYLTRQQPRPGRFEGRHPALVLTLRLSKNLLGAILVVAGVVMLFTPGQGLLAILVGVWLLDIPGKRHLEQRVIGQPKVLQAINAVRRKAHRPPLESPH